MTMWEEPRFSLGIYVPQTCPHCGQDGRHHERVRVEWVDEPYGDERTTVGYACECGHQWERDIIEERRR